MIILIGDNVNTRHNSYSKVSDFMLVFNQVLEKLFVKKNHTINAKLIINQLKERKVDIDKVQEFMNRLPKGEWNLKVFADNIDELNKIFGVSNEQILEYSVTNVDEKDIPEIRWKIIIESLSEYSRFSTEYYDVLKYNVSADLSVAQIKLLNEFMLVFKLIKDTSKDLYDRYKNKKFTKKNIIKVNESRIVLEFFILRILYISLNLKKADNNQFERFAKLLGKERISLLYQKKYMRLFS